MCYEHMLTQDPERLLEDEPAEASLEEPSHEVGADDRPEPMPDTDPTEPVEVPD